MQKFNYHSHTCFQNIFDGQNTADEMIAAAEAKGFEEWGISNHCIWHPSFAAASFCHPMFFSDLNKLIDVFKRSFEWIDEAAARHNIKVRKGMEVDFFPSAIWRNSFEKIIKELQPDYLIGATHFIRSADESQLYNIYFLDTLRASASQEQMEELLNNYWQNIIFAIESGYFNFMAHPDYCCQFGLSTGDKWIEIKQKVIEALTSTHTACEINTGGLRRIGRPFPDWWMIEEMIKKDVALIISDDSHRIVDVGSHFAEVEAKLGGLGCKKRFSF